MKCLKVLILVLLGIATIDASANSDRRSVKKHYIELFQKGHVPKNLPTSSVNCYDVEKPSTGFAGHFRKIGSSVGIVKRDEKDIYDLLVVSNNALQGRFSMMRETKDGDILMVGAKSFLGIALKVHPDHITPRTVQILVCDI